MERRTTACSSPSRINSGLLGLLGSQITCCCDEGPYHERRYLRQIDNVSRTIGLFDIIIGVDYLINNKRMTHILVHSCFIYHWKRSKYDSSKHYLKHLSHVAGKSPNRPKCHDITISMNTSLLTLPGEAHQGFHHPCHPIMPKSNKEKSFHRDLPFQ